MSPFKNSAAFIDRVASQSSMLYHRRSFNYMITIMASEGPLSKVYTRTEANELFSRFVLVDTEVRYLNLGLYPGGERFSRSRIWAGARWTHRLAPVRASR